jgi:hypothetical protein
MDRVIFLNQETHKPFEWDADAGVFVRPQFSRHWYVQVDSPDHGTLAVYFEGKLEKLIWDDSLGGYRLKSDSDKSRERADKINAVAGLVEIVRCAEHPAVPLETLAPGLWTVPASLSSEDYRELLYYLKGIAIKYGETAKALVKGPASRGDNSSPRGSQSVGVSGLIGLADIVIGIGTSLQQVWPRIVVDPSAELVSEMKTFRLDQPASHRSPHFFKQAIMRPDRPSVTLPTAAASFDTQENRFLAYFLDVLIRVSDVILSDLKSQITKLGKSVNQSVRLPEDFPLRLRREYERKCQEQQQRLAKEIEQRTYWLEQITDAQTRARMYINATFLRTSAPHKSPPDRPSQKLLQSTTYAPLFRAYREFAQALDVKRFVQTFDVLDHWQEVAVRPIDDLYEKWLFLKLHQILVDEFHFQPLGLTPEQSLKVTPTGLELPKKTPYVLEMRDPDQPGNPCICQVELVYEPVLQPEPCQKGKPCFVDVETCSSLHCFKKIMVKEEGKKRPDWHSLKPDISLVVKVNCNTFRFILDAKYRSYDAQCVRKEEMDLCSVQDTFEFDVLVTAKMKYLDGLARDGHDVQASFIVHTDPRSKWTFWGGERLSQRAPRRESVLESPGRSLWPGHRFGAVYATPLASDNLSVLLKCFLMYHAGLYNICWKCGRRLTVDNGGAMPGECPVTGNWTPKQIVERVELGLYKWAAVYYHCPDCNEFWVLQRCDGPQHHPILKFGVRSFHSPSRTHPENNWLNICPQCGSDFPAEDKLRLSFGKDTSRKRD